MINLQFMKWFVRTAALYNASAVVIFLLPGGLTAFGVAMPYSSFWVWLPSLLALFGSVVLFFASRDLMKYGLFPYWNGIIRLIFVVAAFVLDFGGSVSPFITLLALGDLLLGAGCILGLPRVLNCSHLNLLTGNNLLQVMALQTDSQ